MPRRRTVAAMEQDARALDLHYRGVTYRKIAAHLGWKNQASAFEAVRRAIADGYRLSAEDARRVEDERLDELVRAFSQVMGRRHYVATASGKIALHPETGEPLIDDGPVIAAGLALLRVSESRRKLRGLDSPVKHEVRTIDAIDAKLFELADQMEPVEP
jgi:hypothetical protein